MVSTPTVPKLELSILDHAIYDFSMCMGYFNPEHIDEGYEVCKALVTGERQDSELEPIERVELHDFIFALHCKVADATPMHDRMYSEGKHIDFMYSRDLEDFIPIMPTPTKVLRSLINNSYIVLMALDYTDDATSYAIFKSEKKVDEDFVNDFIRSVREGGVDTIKVVVQSTRQSDYSYMSIDFNPVP